jgi:hypothetical protein
MDKKPDDGGGPCPGCDCTTDETDLPISGIPNCKRPVRLCKVYNASSI